MDKVNRRWKRPREETSQQRSSYNRSAAHTGHTGQYKSKTIPLLEIKKNIICAEEVNLDLKRFITNRDYEDDLVGILPFTSLQNALSFHWGRVKTDPDSELEVKLDFDYERDFSRPHAYANNEVDLIKRIISTPSVRKLRKIHHRCKEKHHFDRVIKLLQALDETNQNIGIRTTSGLHRVPSVLLDKSAEQFLFRIERLLKIENADIYSSSRMKTEFRQVQYREFLKYQPDAVNDMFSFIPVPKSFMILLRFYIQQVMKSKDIQVLKSLMDGNYYGFSWTIMKFYFISFVINLDYKSFDYFCSSSEQTYLLFQAFLEAEEENFGKRPWTNPDKILEMRNGFAQAKRTATRFLFDWRIVSEPLQDNRKEVCCHRIYSSSKAPLRKTSCNAGTSNTDQTEKNNICTTLRNSTEKDQNSVITIKEEQLFCSSSAPNPSASASRVGTITRRVKKIRRKAISFSSNTMSEVKMFLTSSRFYQHLDPELAANENNNYKRNGELTSFLVNRILPFHISCIDEVDEGIHVGDSDSDGESTAVWENENKNGKEATCQQANENHGNVTIHETNDVAKQAVSTDKWLDYNRLRNLFLNK